MHVQSDITAGPSERKAASQSVTNGVRLFDSLPNRPHRIRIHVDGEGQDPDPFSKLQLWQRS